MRTTFFYSEFEEEELYLLFLPEFFFSTYNLFAFLNPLVITFLVSSSITFHLVDLNIIVCPLSSMCATLRMLCFSLWINNALAAFVCLSSLVLHFPKKLVVRYLKKKITIFNFLERLKLVIISRHVMRASTVYVPFIFIFKWPQIKVTLKLFFFHFLNMWSAGGSIFLGSFGNYNLVWFLSFEEINLFSVWIHWLVYAFFCYMPKLVTSITSYMTRKGNFIIFMLHISLISINIFVTNYIACKIITPK